MATSHLGRKKKKSGLFRISDQAEVKMNRNMVRAMNYTTGRVNIKKITRQKLTG